MPPFFGRGPRLPFFGRGPMPPFFPNRNNNDNNNSLACFDCRGRLTIIDRSRLNNTCNSASTTPTPITTVAPTTVPADQVSTTPNTNPVNVGHFFRRRPAYPFFEPIRSQNNNKLLCLDCRNHRLIVVDPCIIDNGSTTPNPEVTTETPADNSTTQAPIDNSTTQTPIDNSSTQTPIDISTTLAPVTTVDPVNATTIQAP